MANGSMRKLLDYELGRLIFRLGVDLAMNSLYDEIRLYLRKQLDE